MTNSAPLFDRALQRVRLKRAMAHGYAGFLLERAVEDMDERLGAILRQFKRGADIGTPRNDASRFLVESGRVEAMMRLAPFVDGAGMAAIEEVEGDEEVIPFPAHAFDIAVSLLALHGVNDLPGTLIQIHRLLKPDGLFLACLFGNETLTELRQVMMQAESEVEGGVSPRIAPFTEIRDAGSLLQRAGFALPVVDSDRLTVRYDTMYHLMRDLRAMGLTNAMSERSRKTLRRETLQRAATLYAERFADADGRIRATFDLLWLAGWSPHESQQQPLRPGSAKMSFAEMLKKAGEQG